MSNYIKFACGCEFKYEQGQNKKLISFDADYDNINENCSATYRLISEGDTKGCFQIETGLGKKMCREAPIQSIDDIANIIAIMRPACTNSFMDDGKSLAQHYIDRRKGIEEVTYINEAVKPYLKRTYGILAYQEDVMFIAKDLAGFTPGEADDLRSAGAKKRADLMAQIKPKFINGCAKVGKVNEHDAKLIWDWIEAGQRYLFNASHSYGYAKLTYVTAYLKAHFQKEFFAGWLENSHLKQQNRQYEILSLTNNMKINNVAEISSPSILRMNQYFKLSKDTIYFGFSDIKGVGESAFNKMVTRYNTVKELIGEADKWSYMDNLILFMSHLSSASIEPCIKVGVFSSISSNRTKMLFDYKIYEHLTDKEKDWCTANYHKSENLLSLLLDLRTHFKFRGKNRILKIDDLINSLQNPPEKLEDNITIISDDEQALLGMTITCSQIDSCDISMANSTCRDLINKENAKDKNIMLAAEISKVSEFTIKNGKNAGQKMGALEVKDSDCCLDGILVFGKTWKDNRHVLVENNTVMLMMKKSYKNDSFTVEKVWQI